MNNLEGLDCSMSWVPTGFIPCPADVDSVVGYSLRYCSRSSSVNKSKIIIQSTKGLCSAYLYI